jgi:hypothetical protein
MSITDIDRGKYGGKASKPKLQAPKKLQAPSLRSQGSQFLSEFICTTMPESFRSPRKFFPGFAFPRIPRIPRSSSSALGCGFAALCPSVVLPNSSG